MPRQVCWLFFIKRSLVLKQIVFDCKPVEQNSFVELYSLPFGDRLGIEVVHTPNELPKSINILLNEPISISTQPALKFICYIVPRFY
jgi:hypothetical protein